ncbi:MAG: chalcone isomerase family protein [Rubrivivax sp.]|nr:chalcone isomerase family protein [Rubrivivax sp.]
MAAFAQPQATNLTRRAWLGLAVGAGVLGGIGPQAARAATFEGVQFDDRITLAGRELLLNGTGLRAAGWFKAYVAALYLPKRAGTAAEVLEQTGPKRVRLVLLVDAPAVELAKGFDKGVKRNSGAEVEALRVRLARMFELMDSVGKVHKGDAVDLDFDPARGTTLSLNGKARGEPIAGNDFYVAVLRSFVGEHPYHKKLRSGLLGTPA